MSLLIDPELVFDLLERREIVSEQRLPIAHRLELPLGHRDRHAQRVQQLQLGAARRVQRRRDVILQRLEAARRPERWLSLFGAERELRAHEEDLRLEPEERARVLCHERTNLRDLRGPFEDVALVDDHDDFLAPPANVLHEAAFGLGEGAIGGRDEKHQVGAGNELRGHRLVLADDGVGAGRVDDADFSEQVDRRFDDEQVRLTHRLLRVVAVLEDGDHRCRRRDAFFHQRLADERVDEGAFPGVELADDDEEKELVELGNGLVEGLLLIGGRRPRAQARFAAA